MKSFLCTLAYILDLSDGLLVTMFLFISYKLEVGAKRLIRFRFNRFLDKNILLPNVTV